MNISQLKRFASSARRKLIEQVAARLEYVLTTDSAELRSRSQQLRELNELITNKGKIPTIEKVAYTWFNRLMALRFMDANSYTAIKVLTPAEGMLQPEVLEEAKRGHIEEGVKVNLELINNFLDGRTSSNNPQNEVYRHLLVAVCNFWHTAMPFLFERIDDYTELLMPDDLLSDNSIVTFIRLGMTDEDCQNVEIIGWLYQFYIAEKKDQVFASKSKVKAEDIPAATQLFTPRWIVEYMVQNTIGKLWLRNKPASGLKAEMPYYIESPAEKETTPLKISTPLELNLLDPACGSGHILIYGFDLLCKIYEEEGYSTSEIPYLILEHNLVGIDIDERAAQLSAFALVMKARAYYPRFFRKPVEPKITALKDFSLNEADAAGLFVEAGFSLTAELKHDLNLMRQASNFGSLIIPHTSLSVLENLKSSIAESPLLQQLLWQTKTEELLTCITQLVLLGTKYTCIAANPPYMGGGMNLSLNTFVKTYYPKSKSDLMACFMESGLLMLQEKGSLGMINQHSWMFLSSYQSFRKKLIENIQFDSTLHLGTRTFPEIGGEVVQNVAFIFLNQKTSCESIYIRLIDEKSTGGKAHKALEAIKNDDDDRFYLAKQKDFEKIMGEPIAYWVSRNMLSSISSSQVLGSIYSVRKGIDTGKNEKFLRNWNEVEQKKTSGFGSQLKWYFYIKGGGFNKWYGNFDLVVNWANDGKEIKEHPSSTIRNKSFFFKPAITWSLTSSNCYGARVVPPNCLFDNNGSSIFPKASIQNKLVSLLNSSFTQKFLDIINPTLAYQVGDIARIPVNEAIYENQTIENLSSSCISISKTDWNARDTSWDFEKNELVKHKTTEELADAFDNYQQFWETKFFQLHKNEEELNHIFIDIYDLREELTPEVALKDITILQEELFRPQLEQIRLKRDEETGLVQSYEGLELPFNKIEVIKQFVSYAVGCMFGRYSLAKPGLILANAGQTIQDYNDIISDAPVTLSGVEEFSPDTDGIIPVLDDEYFQDDVVSKFNQFLKASFGETSFEKNLHFIEDALGKDIRKYLTKDFYPDHIKRYKKRPIYWMFSSPKKGFNVLVYLHRYSTDTVSLIRNQYLNPFIEKLKANKEHLVHIKNSATATPAEKTKADKRIIEIEQLLVELANYEREVIYPLATEQIALDLDDGVLVNYNKFGTALQEVKGLSGAVKVQEEQTAEIS